MHDIEVSIDEYCAQNLASEPIWISLLNRRFPKIAARLDSARSVQWEIADHLRNSYEDYLLKGQNPEDAWKFARERFGDISVISREIHKARTQSYKCLMIRFLAIITLVALPLGKIAQVRFSAFFHPSLLCFLAVCAAAGFLITRKRDLDSLRKYALYGAWLSLACGVVLAITVKDVPTEIGAAVALILMSTFYGLFLASPDSRGYVPIIMMALCQFGVLISLPRVGFLSLNPGAVDAALLKMIAAFSIVSVLIGLICFDIRKLHRRLAGVAVFGMVFAYIQILSNLHSPYATLLDCLCATSIPPLIAVLFILPIRKLQGRLLQQENWS